MSASDLAAEDLAEGDSLSGTDGYVATDTTPLDATTDPDTAITVDGIDPIVALGLADTSTATTTDTSTTTTTDTSTTTVGTS